MEEKRTATKMKSGSSTEENGTGILRPPAYRMVRMQQSCTVQYGTVRYGMIPHGRRGELD